MLWSTQTTHQQPHSEVFSMHPQRTDWISRLQYALTHRYGVLGLLCLIQSLPTAAEQPGAGPIPVHPEVTQPIPQEVAVIQIAPPNNQGLSHNQFQQFNVSEPGTILNNSAQASHTQLAGEIAGNPRLAQSSAQIILNEVLGNLPSRLQSTLEVAGTAAQVIIANPNGIDCNGCRFINSHRVSLLTAVPQFSPSKLLQGFDFGTGALTLSGSGWDAREQNRIDLISQAITINGPLQGKNITLMIPSKPIRSSAPLTSAQSPPSSQQPTAVDIDAVLYGGHYPQQIKLISTEQGLGVNTAGLQWSQPILQLEPQGRLTVNTQDTPIPYALDNHATITGELLTLYSSGNLYNRGTISGKQQVNLLAENNLHNHHGSLQSDGELQMSAQGDLSLTATTLKVHQAATLFAGGNLLIQPQITTQQPDQATPRSQHPTLQRSTLYSGGALKLLGQKKIQITGATLQSGDQLQIAAWRDLLIRPARVTSPARQISPRPQQKRWQQHHLHQLATVIPSTLSAQRDLQISAGTPSQRCDLTVVAARLSSGKPRDPQEGQLTLSATGSLKIQGLQNSHQNYHHLATRHPGWFKSRQQIQYQHKQQIPIPSQLSSSGTTTLQAGGNLQVMGSALSSHHQLQLQAAGDLNLVPLATTSQHNVQQESRRWLGLRALNWNSASLGRERQQLLLQGNQRIPQGSLLESTQGSIILQAGQAALINGSRLTAAKKLWASAQTITIKAAQQSQQRMNQQQHRQWGLTLGLTGPLSILLNTALELKQTVPQISDPSQRSLALLRGSTLLLEGEQAIKDCHQIWNDPQRHPLSVLELALSLMRQQTAKVTQKQQESVQSSELRAGTTLHLRAHTAASLPLAMKSAGRVTIEGSLLRGKNITLEAQQDLKLQSTATQQHTLNSQRGRSCEIGMTGNLVPLPNALSPWAGARHQGERRQWHEQTQRPTYIIADDLLRLRSGQHTRLTGALGYGQRLQLTARQLTLISQQHHEQTCRQQQQLQGKTQLSRLSASANAHQNRSSHQVQQLHQPTGLLAGSAGFAITVQDQTKLRGAFIYSTAPAKVNSLATGTLAQHAVRNANQQSLRPNSLALPLDNPLQSLITTAVAQGTNQLLARPHNYTHFSLTPATISPSRITLRPPLVAPQSLTLPAFPDHALQTLLRPPLAPSSTVQQVLQQGQRIHQLSDHLISRVSKGLPNAAE